MKFLKGVALKDKTSDEALLKGYAQTADLTLLAALFERYVHLVYGVCLKYLRDEEQSKDAVMQIFEELIIKVNRQNIKQFKSWLYVLSRNHCLMQLRAGKKTNQVPLDGFMELADDLHPDDDQEENLSLLAFCKEKLPEAQRLSIELFYSEEKCYKEIAERTGYSMNEVKSYIQNGKRNLKICLEKNREN